jgi:hypothetical protein
MTPDEFPAVFTHGWALPKPDAFLDYFLPMIAPDATFVQVRHPRRKDRPTAVLQRSDSHDAEAGAPPHGLGAGRQKSDAVALMAWPSFDEVVIWRPYGVITKGA